jgi:hypothetical protein
VLSIARIKKLESLAICNSEIETYMGKFVSRKMAFLIKSYGVSSKDLTTSMIERAIYNLRINYPNWKASGDMLAMCKSAIANSGHNLILYYTADKRTKLTTSNTGVEISLDFNGEANWDSVEYSAIIMSETFDRGMATLEATLSLDSIFKKQQHLPKKFKVLQLLAGKYDFGFSEFLGTDNSDFSDAHDFETTLSKVCDYTGLDLSKVEAYLETLR